MFKKLLIALLILALTVMLGATSLGSVDILTCGFHKCVK